MALGKRKAQSDLESHQLLDVRNYEKTVSLGSKNADLMLSDTGYRCWTKSSQGSVCFDFLCPSNQEVKNMMPWIRVKHTHGSQGTVKARNSEGKYPNENFLVVPNLFTSVILGTASIGKFIKKINPRKSSLGLSTQEWMQREGITK